MLAKGRNNDLFFQEYSEKCQALIRRNDPDDVNSCQLVPEKTFLQLECELFNETMLDPPRNVTFTVKGFYTSPKGRNHYEKLVSFDPEAIVELFALIEKRNEYLHSAKRQRALMTPKLRYAVMKRDGFRCQLCGATSREGARLEVDHIIPVSKGGKTTMDNLQTLCSACNQGKRDQL